MAHSSNLPPQKAIDAYLSPTTRHIRRVEIYEQDGITRWARDKKARLKDGSISVDQSRDERRTLDLTLDNSDGELLNAPGEFWYDKVIKVFRGVHIETTKVPPRILIVSDKTGQATMAGALREVLVNSGFGDVQVNVLADTPEEVQSFDILVGLSGSSTVQINLLRDAYKAGKSVMVLDVDASAWIPAAYPDAGAGVSRSQSYSESSSLGTTSRTNLITHPSFELNADAVPGIGDGWVSYTAGSVGTVTYSLNTTNYIAGTKSQRVQASALGAGDANRIGIKLGAAVGVSPSKEYTLSVDIIGTLANGKEFVIEANENSSTGAYLRTRQKFTVGGGRAFITFTTGVDAASLSIFLFISGANSMAVAAIDISFDAVLLETAGSALAYFDGSTHPGLTAWSGTAHASTSIYTPSTDPTVVTPFTMFPHPVAQGWDKFQVIVGGATNTYTFTNDERRVVGTSGSDGSIPRVTSFSNSVGGRAVAFSFLIDYRQFDIVAFENMIVSAARWLDTVEPIDEWETQVGEFMIDRISEPHFPHEVKVTGRDYTKKCMNSKFAYATQFETGYTLEALVAAIAGSAGINKRQLPITGVVVGRAFFFERGVSRWEAMKEICNAYNYEIYFNPQGFLVMRAYEDPSTSVPVVYIHTGKKGQVASYEKSTSDSRIYNHVIVTGESSDAAIPPVYAEAINDDPNSPTNRAELGDRVYEYTSSFITTTAQAQAVADKILAVHALEEFELSFASLMLPWLEVGDILGFIDPAPAPGDPTTFLLVSLSFPLKLGPMGGSARRITNVG